MVQLKTKRTALSLYAVLLVLPTLVLGLLHWYQLALDHERELDDVPKKADDAALRLVEAVKDQLGRLMEQESNRPFYHFGDVFTPEQTVGDEFAMMPSPLAADPLPKGIKGYFSYNLKDGPGAEIDLYMGSDSKPERADEMQEAARELANNIARQGILHRFSRLGQIQTAHLSLVAAAVNQTPAELRDCVAACAPLMRDHKIPINYSQYHLQFYVEPRGTPRVAVTRRVILTESLRPLAQKISCLGPIADGFGLVQGFFIDPDWLFHVLPKAVANQVLGESERFLPMGEARLKYQGEEYQSEIWLVDELGLETNTPEDAFFGLMKVAIDMGALNRHFRSQTWRFLGVAAMLTLSLGTGMVLLMRSVSLELEQASRTENFVAAVTHELRTPLSAIRLHGEMLLQGWVSDADKQREYHTRIVRETNRLSTLVERVLEKSRLTSEAVKPIQGDLNASVERVKPQLAAWEEAEEDLVFDLAADLPPVWLHQDAVAGILVNLVENARKYAPYQRQNPGSAPICVRTRAAGSSRVALEVADRGPGIPPEERDKIFDAFYRSGSEATRTSKGTGLGLHLVALHADSIGAKVEVLDNPEGGALFRILLRGAS